MDPYLVALAGQAGTAVVALMVNESWQQARDGIVAVWRRHRPQSTDDVERELEASRRELLSAAHSGDSEAEEAEARNWQQRLAELLAEHPDAADDVRALMPDSGPAASRQDIRGGVRLEARASDSARVYQSLGDQHIHEW